MLEEVCPPSAMTKGQCIPLPQLWVVIQLCYELTGTLSGCFSLIFEASAERTSGGRRKEEGETGNEFLCPTEQKAVFKHS